MKKYITQYWYENRRFEVTDRITITKKGSLIHLKENISWKEKEKEKENKGLILEGRSLGIVQMWVKKNQSLTLDRKDKVKHYIRIKTHNTIALRFWYKNGVKYLICIGLMSCNHMKPKP